MPDELADIARALLRITPDAFVTARTARVRDARSSDRDLARQVGAIRKPSPAAWAIDLLAERGLLDEVADLAPELRRAQASADPDEIARLRGRRRELVRSCTDAAADLAVEAGSELGAAARAQVSATVEAATADPRAAAAVRSGLLLRALEGVGFEPVDLAGALAVPEAVPEAAEVPAEPGGDDLTDRHRASRPGRGPKREPEPPVGPDPRILRDARAAASAAEAALADLDESIRAAEERLRDLEDRRGPLDRAVREARRALSRAERDAAV